MPISIVGNGSITGLTAGGLPDASVTNDDLATGIASSKLSGALPALDGSSLTGVGVDGIVSSANATAITIDSNENIGIGAGSPSSPALGASGTTHRILEIQSTTGAAGIVLDGNSGTHDAWDIFASGGRLDIKDNDVLRLRLESDGRGLSQFTAKAWVDFNGQGTVAIRDSHNVSSINDSGTGWYYVMHTNNRGSTSGAAVASVSNAANTYNCNAGTAVQAANHVALMTWGDQTGTSHTAHDFSHCYVIVFGD